MGRRAPARLLAVLVAALVCACNLITGASDLDTGSAPEGTSEGGVDVASGSDASSDRGGPNVPDVVASSDANPDASCVALNGTCTAAGACCGSNACNAGNKCATTCSAQGASCTYQQRDKCCLGLGCDLRTDKCAVCKNDGMACTEPNGLDATCCGGICFGGKCITD